MVMAAKARAGRPWEAVCAYADARCAGQVRAKGRGEIPTFVAFANAWTSGELAKKHTDHVKAKRSAELDAQRFRSHVFPHLEGIRIDEFTLEHAEFVMANLSTDFAQGTRRQIAQLMGRLMRLAVYPCKWRKENRIPAGWLPRGGDAKAKECLFPDEDVRLMRGVSVEPGKPDVPVLRRLAYGFLAREGMRTSEMGALRWKDVDLERGRIYLDHDKTDDPRDWDLRRDVVDALARWKERQPCTKLATTSSPTTGCPSTWCTWPTCSAATYGAWGSPGRSSSSDRTSDSLFAPTTCGPRS
jgi:integrase